MTHSIVVQHLSGSKVNRVEQFPLEDTTELTIGRDPDSAIRYDPLRDREVSRKHAVLRIMQGPSPRFSLADLGSTNRTLRNGALVSGEIELFPGDVVELGEGGPRFKFDIEPPLPNLLPQTTVRDAATIAGTTRVIGGDQQASSMPPPAPAATTISSEPSIRPYIGRDTFFREVKQRQMATTRVGLYALAGVLAVIGAVGGAVYYANQRQTQAAITSLPPPPDVKKTIHEVNGLTPEEVNRQFGNATVLISLHWRLYDTDTGKPLFHKTIYDGHGNYLPAYVAYKGKVYRWLTAEEDTRTNFPIQGEGAGSGFVIGKQGLILTNRHVAAGWMVTYLAYTHGDTGRGLLYEAQGDFYKSDAEFMKKNKPTLFDMRQDAADMEKFKSIVNWRPDSGGLVFANNQPKIIGKGEHLFEGRNDSLTVRFPGNPLEVAARLVRASTEADVALIQIDTTQPDLATIPLAPDDEQVKVGENVTVLGYPGFSIHNTVSMFTVENGTARRQVQEIPKPTVTPGIVSNIAQRPQQIGTTLVSSDTGNLYQMTVPSGPGNSGGPVFDARGNAIGLFTYGDAKRDNVTYAVPISYAQRILRMQERTN